MWEAISKHNSEYSDSLSKAADPGNVKKQKECITCSRSLRDYLATIMVNNEVPLSYAFHKNPDPNYGDKAFF